MESDKIRLHPEDATSLQGLEVERHYDVGHVPSVCEGTGGILRMRSYFIAFQGHDPPDHHHG